MVVTLLIMVMAEFPFQGNHWKAYPMRRVRSYLGRTPSTSLWRHPSSQRWLFFDPSFEVDATRQWLAVLTWYSREYEQDPNFKSLKSTSYPRLINLKSKYSPNCLLEWNEDKAKANTLHHLRRWRYCVTLQSFYRQVWLWSNDSWSYLKIFFTAKNWKHKSSNIWSFQRIVVKAKNANGVRLLTRKLRNKHWLIVKYQMGNVFFFWGNKKTK